MAAKFIPTRETFMARVTVLESGCWAFRGERTRLGYVRLFTQGRRVLAHRLAYGLFRGDVPAGFDLDHACRNRSCCNPDHLRPMTHTENCQRRVDAKLTPEDVAEIRNRAASGQSGKRIARDFRVSDTMVYNILNRRAWANI